MNKALRRLRAVILPTKRQKTLKQWFANGGDKGRRFNYDLNENSLVLDLGGYEGQWASDIFAMYRCNIVVFEPVSRFAEAVEARFRRNPKIQVLPFGVGGRSRTEQISVCKDSSSTFRHSAETEDIQILDIVDWLQDNEISSVELMKINIEGGEYELLERLIETGFIKTIRDIQVQFHRVSSGSDARMAEIQRKLKDTHDSVYRYEYVWESWRLRDQTQQAK